MLKFQAIGYCGKDAVVQIHGTESVINFSICHTDKWTDASGAKHERPTWVNCSWWVEKTNVAQYIKKGTLLWCEGVPEAKNWKDKNGESKAYLNMRVARVELLGGKREDNQSQAAPGTSSSNDTGGYKPVETPIDDTDLPF